MLVNARNPLPVNYSPQLSRIGTYNGEERQLDSRAAPFAIALVAAAEADGIRLTLRSTYRSVARQDANFRNSFQQRVDRGMSREEAFDATAAWIAPPGTSEHNAGIAIDFNLIEERFENTPEFAWLAENAHKFGFILRYPRNTQHITGINYEPWHYTFVGMNYAGRIRSSEHATLEQWLGADVCRGDETIMAAFRAQLVDR
jgi:D-alanyl-D-alanine carboxypeptidase